LLTSFQRVSDKMSEPKSKEEKIFCHRCGAEINKYAYVEVVIQPIVAVEDEKFSMTPQVLFVCLKCYYRYNDILNLLRLREL